MSKKDNYYIIKFQNYTPKNTNYVINVTPVTEASYPGANSNGNFPKGGTKHGYIRAPKCFNITTKGFTLALVDGFGTKYGDAGFMFTVYEW